MRGEKAAGRYAGKDQGGSPPRARGEVCFSGFGPDHRGITPACAGRSPTPSPSRFCAKDHPRVRGEKTNAWTRPLHNIGSPPRARGEVHGLCNSEAVRRITPACAGRSLSPCSPRALGGDHPRVRGEKYSGFCFFRSLRGSPPCARGEVAVQRVYLDAPRITPACAGRSTFGSGFLNAG